VSATAAVAVAVAVVVFVVVFVVAAGIDHLWYQKHLRVDTQSDYERCLWIIFFQQ